MVTNVILNMKIMIVNYRSMECQFESISGLIINFNKIHIDSHFVKFPMIFKSIKSMPMGNIYICVANFNTLLLLWTIKSPL